MDLKHFLNCRSGGTGKFLCKLCTLVKKCSNLIRNKLVLVTTLAPKGEGVAFVSICLFVHMCNSQTLYQFEAIFSHKMGSPLGFVLLIMSWIYIDSAELFRDFSSIFAPSCENQSICVLLFLYMV